MLCDLTICKIQKSSDLKWANGRALPRSTGSSAQGHAAAGEEGRLGESGHMRMRQSPCTVRLKPSQHFLLTGYTPIQNKRLEKPSSWWLPGVGGRLVRQSGTQRR